MMPGPMLSVTALDKQYGDLRAVDGLTFSVGAGEVLGLVEPNGAGKTTTLRCLSGVVPPTSGRVVVAGHDLALAPVEAKRQLDYLTVKEHLALVARLYDVGSWEERGRALLEELELTGKEGALPGELSRGMKQKLTIACGFLHDPRLIVLDEPLTGLDPLAIRKMKQSLKARAAAGAALILSSHLLPLVEELCQRVLVIAGGRMVAHGTIDEIRGALAGGAGDSLEELFIRITTAGAGEPLATAPVPGR
jgi:ABC-2 type transport system ATP-binding protein